MGKPTKLVHSAGGHRGSDIVIPPLDWKSNALRTIRPLGVMFLSDYGVRALNNTIRLICWVALAIVFNRWWLVFFVALFWA